MPYARLLNEYIEKSGISTRDIAKKCAKAGQSVSPSYISILRNEDSKRVPSDELSSVLEKILGADEGLFVLEAYLEKAPDILNVALRNFYNITVNQALNIMGNDFTDEQKEMLFEEANKRPLSELVVEMAKYDDISEYQSMETTIDDGDETTTYVAKIMLDSDLEVLDDSLAPMIKKGSKIKLRLEQEYKSGDIIAYKTKKDDTMKIRKLIIGKKKQFMMFPFNSEYETEEYNRSEIIILGKVDSVLTKI